MQPRAIRFVHGPDYQQLQIWLPDYGRFYREFTLRNESTGEILWKAQVADHLQGSVQLLLNPGPWPHAQYLLYFFKQDGCIHEVPLVKGKEQKVAPPVVESPTEPITYRNGAGNVLPEQDLVLRQKAMEKIVQAFSSHVRVVSEGRGGHVIYREAGKQMQLWWEFGGGNCVAFIDVPPPGKWEAFTPFPLGDRKRIVQEIAEAVARDQFGTVRISISETAISFYRK